MDRQTPIKDAAVHRLAKSITQLTLCQVTTSEVEAAYQPADQGISEASRHPEYPIQRVTDLKLPYANSAKLAVY